MPLNERAERAAYVGNARNRMRLIAWAALGILLASSCNPSDQSESGAMFFFKKSKPDVTIVGPAVGAELVRQASFPEVQAPLVKPAVTATPRFMQGKPPQVTFVDERIPEQTKLAFIVDGTAQHPPLAVANVEQRIELWELEDTEKPVFARKRELRIDPKQDDWVIFRALEVACLPNDRLLLAVEHHTPVRYGLYVYDIAAGSFSKLSDVVPLGLTPRARLENEQIFFSSQSKLFDLLLVAPDEMLVLFYTGEQRLAAEVYYATPGHIYAFSQQHPQGAQVLQLSASDGVVERWVPEDKTLWLATQDYRDRKHIKSYAMSLELRKLFTH